MSQATELRNPTLIIFSGPQITFSILFHEFDMYFVVLLGYFYNISNKPIITINTSNINSWHKVSNIRRCLDLWNGDIRCTVTSWNDSHLKPISCRNKMTVNSWALKTISKWISFFQRKLCDTILDIISINFDENYSRTIVNWSIKFQINIQNVLVLKTYYAFYTITRALTMTCSKTMPLAAQLMVIWMVN